MASTDAPQTLTELRTDLLNRIRAATGVTATNTIADRYLNIGLQDLHLHKQWWWAERRAVIVTKPAYSTGMVTVTQGATSVTGASTAWTTADAFGNNPATVGDKITLGSVGDVYVVDAVGGALALTLASRYTGADLSAGSYTIFQDEYAVAADFAHPIDVRLFSEEREIWLIGPKAFYRQFPRNSVRGAPKYATLITLPPSGSAAVRRRVVFGPAPDTTAYTVPYRYVTTNLAITTAGVAQAQLSATTDVPIVPLRYCVALVLNALYHWYRDRKDDARSQEAKAEYEGYVLRMAQDTTPVVEDRLRFVPLTPRIGAARRRRGGRYSTDSRFDQMLT